MKHLLSLKRLNQAGIHHILMPIVVFVLLFGIGGSYFLLKSEAASRMWIGALEVGSTSSGYCMDVLGGSYASGTPVVLNKCNNKVDQKWELMNAGSFQGHAAYTIATYTQGRHLCVDNWGQSKSNGNPLRLYNCNGVDPAERFVWTWVNGNTHNLYNPERARCIDNRGGSTQANNTLDLANCKTGGSANWSQSWFEVGNSASISSAPVSTGGPVVTNNNGGGNNGSTPSTSISGTALQLGSDRKECLENMANSNTANTTVDINVCGNKPSESWALRKVANQNNRFQIVALTSKACIDDPNGAVGTNQNNRVYIYTVPCNTSDNTQIWMWAGNGNHELKNASAAGGCINDMANDKDPGTRMIAYSCSSNASNEQWFEAAL